MMQGIKVRGTHLDLSLNTKFTRYENIYFLKVNTILNIMKLYSKVLRQSVSIELFFFFGKLHFSVLQGWHTSVFFETG